MRRPIPEDQKTDPFAASADALVAIIRVVSPLEERDQERTLNAACAYFGHFPIDKPGEIGAGE